MKPGDWVRVRLGGSHQHMSTARIVAIGSRTLEVKPVGHRKTEVVRIEQCKLWKSRNVVSGGTG